jgi:hypothetical protein
MHGPNLLFPARKIEAINSDWTVFRKYHLSKKRWRQLRVRSKTLMPFSSFPGLLSGGCCPLPPPLPSPPSLPPGERQPVTNLEGLWQAMMTLEEGSPNDSTWWQAGIGGWWQRGDLMGVRRQLKAWVKYYGSPMKMTVWRPSTSTKKGDHNFDMSL